MWPGSGVQALSGPFTVGSRCRISRHGGLVLSAVLDGVQYMSARVRIRVPLRHGGHSGFAGRACAYLVQLALPFTAVSLMASYFTVTGHNRNERYSMAVLHFRHRFSISARVVMRPNIKYAAGEGKHKY